MNRHVTFAEGEYYHLYNRGVEKKKIFSNASDYERFTKLLYVSNGTTPFEFRNIQSKPLANIDRGEELVAIGAYCLMPNHFHILVKEIIENGISQFMEKFTTGYSKYFNTKYKRVGPLFQGRYKAEHVAGDEYLKYLYSYIHLNPVKIIEPTWKEKGIADKKKAEKFLETYRYSSYLDYGKKFRSEQAILTPSEFPEYFLDEHDFRDEVANWLNYADEV